MNRALIIFIKNPILGHVKTRLAVDLGAKGALKVYHTLLEYTKEVSAQVSAERYLYYSHQIDQKDSWPNHEFIKKKQSEGDLGRRMFNALQERKEKLKLIIGSDCPQLMKEDIEAAFTALHDHDLVIGPANDGGYYLVGMKKPHPSLFKGVKWSSETVFSTTLEKAQQQNLKVKILRELVDLDTLDDLNEVGLDY
jgi:hypothetical protein